MEDSLGWRTTFNERQPSMEDDHLWKTTLMENNVHGSDSPNGRVLVRTFRWAPPLYELLWLRTGGTDICHTFHKVNLCVSLRPRLLGHWDKETLGHPGHMDTIPFRMILTLSHNRWDFWYHRGMFLPPTQKFPLPLFTLLDDFPILHFSYSYSHSETTWKMLCFQCNHRTGPIMRR